MGCVCGSNTRFVCLDRCFHLTWPQSHRSAPWKDRPGRCWARRCAQTPCTVHQCDSWEIRIQIGQRGPPGRACCPLEGFLPWDNAPSLRQAVDVPTAARGVEDAGTLRASMHDTLDASWSYSELDRK